MRISVIILISNDLGLILIDWETLLTPSPPQVAARSVRRMWQKHVRKNPKKQRVVTEEVT